MESSSLLEMTISPLGLKQLILSEFSRNTLATRKHRSMLWISFLAAIAYHDKELNPKKMISEQIQPDLYTNDECVAIYKGAPFEVKGKGMCRAQTMSNSGIK